MDKMTTVLCNFLSVVKSLLWVIDNTGAMTMFTLNYGPFAFRAANLMPATASVLFHRRCVWLLLKRVVKICMCSYSLIEQSVAM